MLNKRRQIPKKYLLNDLACIKFKNRPNSSTVKEIRAVVDYAQGARGRKKAALDSVLRSMCGLF